MCVPPPFFVLRRGVLLSYPAELTLLMKAGSGLIPDGPLFPEKGLLDTQNKGF